MGLRQTRSGGEPGEEASADSTEQPDKVTVKKDGKSLKAKFGAVDIEKLGERTAQQERGYVHPDDRKP